MERKDRKTASEGPDGINSLSEYNALIFEALITDIAFSFSNLPGDEIDKEIEEGIRHIIEFLGINRGSLAQISGAKGLITHSCATEGSKPLPVPIPLEDFPGLWSAYWPGR